MTESRKCSMCGRNEFQVKKLVLGVAGAICGECIEIAASVSVDFSDGHVCIPGPRKWTPIIGASSTMEIYV